MTTKDMMDEIKSKVEIEYWRFCYDTPYSILRNGKRIWFSSLEEMYLKVVKNDRPIWDRYNLYKESCIKEGKDYPSYVTYLRENGYSWLLNSM